MCLFINVGKPNDMFRYNKYLIKSTDRFDPEFYSFVGDDVDIMMDEVKHIVSNNKAAFIVYYLKDHSLPAEWVSANPEFVELVKSKSLSSGNIKALFESCYNNPVFGQQLESYINKRMNAAPKQG